MILPEERRAEILRAAADFYHATLWNTPRILAYLKGRKLTEETIAWARLGYAAGGLKDHLLKLGFTPEECWETALVREDGKGFFYRKIIIPYFSHGEVTLLRGRSDPEEADRIYLHLPGYEVRMYGEDILPSGTRIIVTEGEIDALTLRQWGLDAVAIPGTGAFKPEWGKQFEHCQQALICFDADPSGERGAAEAAEILGEKASIIKIPDGKDVNEFVCRGHTKEEFEELLANAKGGLILAIERLPHLPEDAKARSAEQIMRRLPELSSANRVILQEELRKALGWEKKLFERIVKETTAQWAKEGKEKFKKAEFEVRSRELLKTPSDLYQIHALLDEMSSASHDLVELLLACSISLPVTQAAEEALVWLMAVGAPSGDKTNQASLLKEMPQIYFLDTLTENAFVTGYVPESGERPNDLLSELNGRCLVIKELGSLFSRKAEVIRQVLGDLQAIYDGQFAKYTGTRGLVKHTAAFSFIGCITPLALSQHQRYMNLIGPRFLFYRLLPLTEEQIRDGFEISWQGEKHRKGRLEKLRRLVSAYGWQRHSAIPSLLPETPEQQAQLNELAVFLAYGRAIVLTERRQEFGEEGKSYSVYEKYGYQREEPFRALQQLKGLARSLAVVHGRNHVTDHELELLRRVVLSSMPPDRAETLLLFQASQCLKPDGGLTRRDTAKSLKRSYNQAKRLLEELESLELLESISEGEGKERAYYPAARFKSLITAPLVHLDHLLDLERVAKNFPQGKTEVLLSDPKTEWIPQGEVHGNG